MRARALTVRRQVHVNVSRRAHHRRQRRLGVRLALPTRRRPPSRAPRRLHPLPRPSLRRRRRDRASTPTRRVVVSRRRRLQHPRRRSSRPPRPSHRARVAATPLEVAYRSPASLASRSRRLARASRRDASSRVVAIGVFRRPRFARARPPPRRSRARVDRVASIAVSLAVPRGSRLPRARVERAPSSAAPSPFPARFVRHAARLHTTNTTQCTINITVL